MEQKPCFGVYSTADADRTLYPIREEKDVFKILKKKPVRQLRRRRKRETKKKNPAKPCTRKFSAAGRGAP